MSENLILVNIEYSQLTVAEVRGGVLFDLEIERTNRLLGNIYFGQVETILPGMDAAFVDIGLSRNALIYAGDIVGDAEILSGTAPQNALSIEKLLQPRQNVVVQIARAPMGSKGARVSGRLSLLGRYVVIAAHSENVGVSRRIENAAERERLRRIAERLRPLDLGIIVRTEAAGIEEIEIARDIDFQVRQLERIRAKAAVADKPTLLHREMGLLGRVVRDRLNERVVRVVVDAPFEYSMLREIVEATLPNLAPRLEFYTDVQPIFARYNIEKAIAATGNRIVDLPRGGYLVIDEAEALTAIDVNTGRYVGKKRLSDTVLQTNLEAAFEAARQLRLRNIGGVIVIDFIDMENTRDRVKVMDALENALKEDRTRTRIVQLSPLGLVEMTRRREGDSLRQLMQQDCPYCDGEGRIESAASVALQAHRDVLNLVETRRLEAKKSGDFAACVTLHPLAAIEFLGHDGEAAQALESAIETPIFLRANSAAHHESRVIESGSVANFVAKTTKLAVGARFEIGREAQISEDSPYFVVNRVLVRLDAMQDAKKKGDAPIFWVEVTKQNRHFVEARVLAAGEPKTNFESKG